MVLEQIKNYQRLEASEVRVVRRTVEEGIERTLCVIDTPFGYRRVGALCRPAGMQAELPAALFVHWYEPESEDSNRSQFEQEAKELATAGALCLMIETLWSDPDFFIKRTQDDDLRASMEEAVNMRRFLDLLLSQPNIDPHRLALVGHDFGGMYSVLAGNVDRRPSHYVVMAATPRFPDWYLYHPKLEAEARTAFIRSMSDLDPIASVAGLSPAAVFFQFATDDPHVPRERAEEFFAAASGPKTMKWYEAGHGLNQEARRDRKAWLLEQLGLVQAPGRGD